MDKNRLRAKALVVTHDFDGRILIERKGFYSGYHQGDITRELFDLPLGVVLVLWYKHGNTLKTIQQSNNFDKFEVMYKTKQRILIINRKDDVVATELCRHIIKEKLWNSL